QQLHLAELQRLPEERRRSELRLVVDRLLGSGDETLSCLERNQLIEEVLDEILGLGPLEQLLRDPTVGDILVNGAREVFVERRGPLRGGALRPRADDPRLQIIERIVPRVGRRIDEPPPLAAARLPEGPRVNVVIPPLALRGPALSIRRF